MPEVKAPALIPSLLKMAEHTRNVFTIVIPPGISLQSVLRPVYWAHVAQHLKPYSRVECRAADNKWLADLMVASAGKQEASMWVLNYVDIEAQAKKGSVDDSEYRISFAPRQRWRVIRASDGMVVHKDCATEDEASEWVKQQA